MIVAGREVNVSPLALIACSLMTADPNNSVTTESFFSTLKSLHDLRETMNTGLTTWRDNVIKAFTLESVVETLVKEDLIDNRGNLCVPMKALTRVVQNGSGRSSFASEGTSVLPTVRPESKMTFDEVAYALYMKHSVNGRLSKDGLSAVVKELDARTSHMKGSFLDRFEPSPRKKIGEFNSKHSALAVCSFEQAIARPEFVRGRTGPKREIQSYSLPCYAIMLSILPLPSSFSPNSCE